MEVLHHASHLPKASWLIEESKRSVWTSAENKQFETALALYDKDTPDRWQRVADLIPGKTVGDVMRQYQELEDDVIKIEAGLFPVRQYAVLPFALDWACARRGPASRGGSDHERKKGIPWTEEEHKLFLMGLRKYGKGDWRNISRNFVVTRTPTQVASHAQKYFIRQISGRKDKRRASIHDITTVTLETRVDHENNRSNSRDNSMQLGQYKHQNAAVSNAASLQCSQQGGNGQAAMAYGEMQGNLLLPSSSSSSSYEYVMKLQCHNGVNWTH